MVSNMRPSVNTFDSFDLSITYDFILNKPLSFESNIWFAKKSERSYRLCANQTQSCSTFLVEIREAAEREVTTERPTIFETYHFQF